VATFDGFEAKMILFLQLSSVDTQVPKGRDKDCHCSLTEHHAMEAYSGSGGIAARVLDLGTRWR